MITKVIIIEFYNRKKELVLMLLLEKGKSSFLAVTDKKRFVKIELIKQFNRDMQALYFLDSNKSIKQMFVD